MRSLLVFAMTIGMFASTMANAQAGLAREVHFDRSHSLSIGTTFQQIDAEVSTSRPGLPGATLDLDDLGVADDDTSWMVDYRWRFKPRWGFVASAYTFGNGGTLSTKKDFIYDGDEYEAGASITTDVSIDTYIFDLMYSAYQSERMELMIGGGIHLINFDMSVKGKANIGELEGSAENGASDLLAPLPNLRFLGFYALSDHWAMRFTGGWLSANYEDYSGAFAYAHLQAMYVINEHFMASVGYQFNNVDVKHERSHGRETEVDFQLQGPTLQLSYIF